MDTKQEQENKQINKTRRGKPHSPLTACSVFFARVSFSSQLRAPFWILLAICSSNSSLE